MPYDAPLTAQMDGASMTNVREIITGIGVLSSVSQRRQCKYRVTQTTLLFVEFYDPANLDYSELSIMDSDEFPDGDYELEYLGRRHPLSKRNGIYTERQL
jgi:hypothetical protein